MKKRRFFAIAAGAILLVSLMEGHAWSAPHKTPQFISPGIASASAIQYPANSMAAGAVSLLLSLDSTKQIQNVQVLPDISETALHFAASADGRAINQFRQHSRVF